MRYYDVIVVEVLHGEHVGDHLKHTVETNCDFDTFDTVVHNALAYVGSIMELTGD